MITYIITANTAIAIAPSHPVSNTALNTANIPMIPTITPINGKPMNPKMNVIMVKTMKAKRVAINASRKSFP